MISLTRVLVFAFLSISPSYSSLCDTECPQENDVVCGFSPLGKTYKMFAGRCALSKFTACNKVEIVETPLSYCIKSDSKKTRKMYGDGESCPVFCPIHYRPVCAASKIRDYVYRTFSNGCQLDMLNCRGDDEVSGYVEVPLSFCPNHYMKNIFKDQIIGSNLPEYRDYSYDH